MSFPTWTRTLNGRDAMELLDLAEPGMALEDWRARGESRLPQTSRHRRRELMREVERDLLDLSAPGGGAPGGGVPGGGAGVYICGGWFLRLFQQEGPHVRQGLFIGRALYGRGGVREVLEELVHPALIRAEEPLAGPEAARIGGEEWEGFFLDRLPEGTGEPARTKTRQTMQRHLALAGVLDLGALPATRAQRARPAPLAFAWLVLHEMERTGRSEARLEWAICQSFAARLFACEEAYARLCVETGVRAGLMRAGYLAGQPRLHTAGDGIGAPGQEG